MPNMLSHMVVAERLHETCPPDVMIGSALPDFVNVYNSYGPVRITLDEAARLEGFGQGVELHLATDVIFDGLPEVDALIAAGLEDCATVPDLKDESALAIMKMGTDILLDEPVLESGIGISVYGGIQQAVASGEVALKRLSPPVLATMIEHFFQRDLARAFENKHDLAVMMNDRFQRRGKGAEFDYDLVPEVAALLERQLERVRQCADHLIDLTVAGLAGFGEDTGVVDISAS